MNWYIGFRFDMLQKTTVNKLPLESIESQLLEGDRRCTLGMRSRSKWELNICNARTTTVEVGKGDGETKCDG
jgi:hypothetical protein